MSKLLLASVLVLSLSGFALADDGIIQGGKAAATPTTTATTVAQSTETTVAAEPIIQTVVAQTATELSLGLLRSMLAIF